jgi:hypothetical protein
LIKYNLNHLARVREIKALQNPDSSTSTPITVQTDILTPCKTSKDCIQVHDLGLYKRKRTPNLQKIGKYRLNTDDILSFSLQNNSRDDYYCYLINITPDGSIYAIYPNPEEGMEYAHLKAREQRSLNEEVILILKNVGEQTIKLIATTTAIDISLLEKEGFKGRNLSDLNPLERLLVSAAHGERGELLLMSNDEWFTGQVAFEVNK